MIPATLLAGITTYIWPFITTKGAYIVLGIVNGLVNNPSMRKWSSDEVTYSVFIGSYASMLTAPLWTMGSTNTVGLRIGMFFSIIALGALAGPPISGAINAATGGYKAVGYYAGASSRSPAMFYSYGRAFAHRHLNYVCSRVLNHLQTANSATYLGEGVIELDSLMVVDIHSTAKLSSQQQLPLQILCIIARCMLYYTITTLLYTHAYHLNVARCMLYYTITTILYTHVYHLNIHGSSKTTKMAVQESD